MTTTPQQAVLRTIFVHPHFGEDGEANTPLNASRGPLPTHRLLRDRGHQVTSTESLSAAIDQMESEVVDLLIVEQPDLVAPESLGSQAGGANSDFEQRAMEQIQSLPLDQQPRDVAFITQRAETVDRSSPFLHGPRVHVLLKPLHVHVLLQMLRNLERQPEVRF